MFILTIVFTKFSIASSNVATYPISVTFSLYVQLREREHLSELQRIEEEISRQRLSTLNSLEAAAKDEMDLMDKVGYIIYCTFCCCFTANARSVKSIAYIPANRTYI